MNDFVGNRGLEVAEAIIFRKAIRGLTGIGVEIGALDGYSAWLAMQESDLHLTSIDPYDKLCMMGLPVGKGLFGAPGTKENYFNNLAPWGGRFNLIQKYSHDARADWDMELDFLFIDGDHSYPAVLQDYKDWTPLIKQGGLLAMHDARNLRFTYPVGWPGPSNVAMRYVYGSDEWEIVDEAWSLLIARKV